ncbi:hypothetical protein DSCA_20010 [Desulfosarcina alkanivorans]|uniref:Uncharacterized protein n=1 Tax=Desulfosarcina alkanivorans TaxID=571177 RepID=A0A5K7YMH4_9BACT|nr:hypothetical protein DSCA_20010 [Desulfosarcina alkanivorans]
MAEMRATFNGSDVSAFLEGCCIDGTLAIGGETLRCPSTSSYLYPGYHTFSVDLELNDGSIVNDTVRWHILSDTEP